ncbi:MAG TPA: hypothetical protein DD671_14880 [Balneolaceae bacterium]|nr:hypothetical protein [Balneolaceae bacterium]
MAESLNIDITHNDLQQTKDNIFFIVGTSRSGSTLFQSMLSSHSKVIVPPETHYFYSREVVNQAFDEAVDKEEFCRKLIDFWYTGKTRIGDLGLDRDEVISHAERLKLWSPLELYVLHLTLYRKHHNKEILGEKTPLHILHVDEILEDFPDARIISMFRDPRAASYSEIKAYFGSPSVLVTTDRWKRYVKVHFEKQEELPSHKYMMKRYWELVRHTEDKLQQVSDFLGIEYEQQMLEYYKRDEKGFAKGEREWKKGTLKPIQQGKNKEWRKALKYWQVALIEEHADHFMPDMGYEPTVKRLSFFKKWFYVAVDVRRSYWATFTNARDEGYSEPQEFVEALEKESAN